MQDTWEAKVACRDGHGRKREAKVVITDTADVALITPPGDAAVWNPNDLKKLVEAVWAAQLEALTRRGLR